MIIKNYAIQDAISIAISKYNDQFELDDSDKKLPGILIDFGNPIDVPEKIIKGIKSLEICLNAREYEKDEIDEISLELSSILEEMNLDLFKLMIKNKPGQEMQVDTSFVNHINESIKHIEIQGIDLSSLKDLKILDKFTELNCLDLRQCNICNPNIIANIKSNTKIGLEQNQISQEYYEDAYKMIARFHGNIDFSDKRLAKVASIFSKKRVDVSDCFELSDIIDFESISGLTVVINEDFKIEEKNCNQILDFLNGKSNINFEINSLNLDKLDLSGMLDIPTKVIIRNARELTQEQLKRHKCISEVQIEDGENTGIEQRDPYNREEYENCRKKIDEILSKIQIPDDNDPNREKKIFAQIYKVLGKTISYDYYAISEDGKENKRLQTTSRNMIGGLLKGEAVCAGYADILRNTLACAGIYSELIGSKIDYTKHSVSKSNPAGHAWNLVLLDGIKYWTDLTWDANQIKTERYPLEHFLKSTKDFKEYDYYKLRVQDAKEDPCLHSIGDDEQMELLETKKIPYLQIAQAKKTGYLSCFAMSAVESGIRPTEIRKEAYKCATLCVKEENKRTGDYINGRD